MAIRILMADDHSVMRAGLAAMLGEETGLEVVGQVDNGREAVAQAKALRPDVVVMDVTMPGLNGIEATRQIVAAAPAVRVVGLSMHGDRHFVAEMVKAGAAGYLLKMCDFEELVEAIRTVAAGKSYVSAAVAGTVLEDYRRLLPEEGVGPAAVLSEREREVLQLLVEGKEAKEIALLLHLSRKTVDTHRRSIMEKLGLGSVAELTKFAIREGLTPLDE